MVAVISNSDKKLMPTSNYKARKLLKKKRAIIYKYNPIFTIKLIDRNDGYTQPIEYASDTGYLYVGVSIKSTKHEYVDATYQLLKDEAERHNDKLKYRRTRRNRLRYRKPRFNNRKRVNGWLAPSIKNKVNVQTKLFEDYKKVIPVTNATFEMGKFDTQVLKAIEEGKPLPQGIDYQQGESYGYATLREAVFSRDNYKCICCGKSAIKDKIILRIHHIGYLKGDRTNRMSNLASVCTTCHTPKNHQKGGKLYGLKPKLRPFKGATFMSMIRFTMINELISNNKDIDITFQYGAKTKQTRQSLNISKSHSNDAYCIGKFRPRHRQRQLTFIKQRRNNRILSKFYDAKYIDSRDSKVHTGKELFNGRVNRNHNLDTENLHIYRSKKVSKGCTTIRKNHYSYRPKDIVLYESKKYRVVGVQNGGSYIKLENTKVVPITKTICLKHCNAWA